MHINYADSLSNISQINVCPVKSWYVRNLAFKDHVANRSKFQVELFFKGKLESQSLWFEKERNGIRFSEMYTFEIEIVKEFLSALFLYPSQNGLI